MSKKKRSRKKSAQPAPPLRVDLEGFSEDLADQLIELQHQLEGKRVWGHAGGGLVKIEMDGMMQVLRCQLAPALLDKKDRELIEDLLVSAFNDAAEKAREQVIAALLFIWADQGELEGLDEQDLIEMAKAILHDKDSRGRLEATVIPSIPSLVEIWAALQDQQEDEEDPPPKTQR